jgi:hypothetical protein
MGKVYSAHSVSVDGYITGRGPALRVSVDSASSVAMGAARQRG